MAVPRAQDRSTPRGRRSYETPSQLLAFLGSMNLAITLLVAVAIASVIGSVLQQDQPWATYQQKFGPFWFEVYQALGLYDVYSAPWFIAMLLFLVTSTSVCIYRHSPTVWKEATRFRERQRDAGLRAHRNHYEWTTGHTLEDARAIAGEVLAQHRFRVRAGDEGERVVLAGMRGRANRLGYVFSHLAIVVICVGGLMDANMGLKWQEWTGQLRIETRDDVPLGDLHEDSRLPPGSTAFRGNISLPEGAAGRAVYLDVRDGYLAQELPFAIEVADFRIDYWDNGEPRSYESDLIIHDPDLDEPLQRTVAVNDPLHHRGHAIYQSSYSDGGTGMDLRLWPLQSTAREPVDGETRVHGQLPVNLGERSYTLEMEDFSRYNQGPDAQSDGESADYGPTYTYRLRSHTGEARQYRTFMEPAQVDGRWYFLTGMRSAPEQDYRYLHIPADRDRELGRFMALLDTLRDDQVLEAASGRAVDGLFRNTRFSDTPLAPWLAGAGQQMARDLLQGGLPAVEQRIGQLLAQAGMGADAEEVMRGFMRDAFHATLAEAYAHTLRAEGQDVTSPANLDDWNEVFFSDAMEVLMVLPAYGAPVFPELRGFDHRQATGLQITRAPGEGVVYAGSFLLVIGLVLMFYVRHRRVWVRLARQPQGGTHWLIAGMDQRRSPAFEQEFASLARSLEQRSTASSRHD